MNTPPVSFKNKILIFKKSFFIFLAAAFLMSGFFAPNAQAAITTINLASPDGGQIWRGTQNITWNGVSNNASDAIDIYYAADGVNFNQVVAPNRLFSGSSYSWTTLTFPETSTARIRISPSGFPTPSDSSTGVFTVDNTDPTTSLLLSGGTLGLAGWYTAPPTITLTCSDGAGSGCFKTYYKWDGAVSWTEYTVPFVALEGERTLSFYSDDKATDASGVRNEETIQTRIIKVDTIAPTVAVTSITPNGAYNESDAINVTLTFFEPVTTTDTITVTLETGATDRTCIVPIMTNATVGTCTYTVQAGDTSSDLTTNSIAATTGSVLDIAGNTANLTPTSSLANTSAIVVDTTAPSAFTTGAVTVTGGTVVATWWNSTNTGATVKVPFALDSSLTGGTMQLQAEADGTFENIGPAEEIFVTYLGGPVAFPLTASQIEAITGFSEGDIVTFHAVITDLAGNSTTGANSVNTETVDQVVPVVDAGADREVNAMASQDATTSDGGSGLATHQWAKITGTGTITFGTPMTEDTTISAGAEDTFGISLTVTDVAGNSASDSIVFVWDVTAPLLTEMTVVPTPTNDTTPNYTFSADSVKQLVASTGGAITYGGTCSSATTNATAGSNTITFNALADVLHNTCTIAVTDATGNLSLTLPITAFEVDTVMANVSSITTTDANLDGMVDTATIVFTDEMNDSTFFAGDFTIGGIPATTFSTGTTANDDTVVLSNAGVAGTNAKMVIYTQGSATDLAGNSIAGFSGTSIDAAKPVLLSARTTSVTTLTATFSEDLDGSTVNDSGNEFAVSGTTVTGADETASGIVTLTYAPALGTGATPSVTFTNIGTFTDLTGNEAVTPTTVVASDEVPPILPTVSIVSNNPSLIYAMEGDTVTLSFTSSEPIATPTVIIQGASATTITDIGAGTSWTASRVMLLADTQGPITFSIVFEDISPAENAGITVTTVTVASSVFFDSVNPLVNAGTDKEVNAIVNQDATVSDPAPSSGGLIYAWTMVSGPGLITFGTPAAEDTTISADTEGTYIIRLMVTDNAGNVTYDELIFIWDTTNPEPLTSSPSDGSTGVSILSGTATVTFDEDIVLLNVSKVLLVNDVTGASYKSAVSVLGGDSASAILNIDYSGLAYGTKYRINVKPNALSDVATNKLDSNFISYFTTEIDTVPPVVNSSSASDITTTGAILNVITNENATCRYAQTDSAYTTMAPFTTTGTTTYSVVLSGLLPSTGYDFYVRCADVSAQANEMTTSAHVSFTTLTPTPDTTAPDVPVITTGDATIDANTYTIAGTVVEDGGSRTITLYNGSDVAGSATIPAGGTTWAILVPLVQDTANFFTATAADEANNISAPSSAVVITEATATGDMTAPETPEITTLPATIDADTYTITGTAGADAPTDGPRTITIYNNGVVMGSIVLSLGETNWSFVVSLNQEMENVFTAYSTDQSGNISDASTDVTITEAFDDLAILKVTGIEMVANANGSIGFAIANNNFDDGWAWIFHITVPTNETDFAMKFADWTSSLPNTIPIVNNVRYSSEQASNGPIEITAANVYGGYLNLTGDLDPGIAGRQIQVKVEAKIPVDSAGGSYSTSYGVISTD